jgi:hypothetical protein
VYKTQFSVSADGKAFCLGRTGLKPSISIVFGPVSSRQEEFSVFVKNGLTEN